MHENIQFKCVRDALPQTIQFFSETRIYRLVLYSNFSKEAQSTRPPGSQPLLPARLGERCLGARWEMAFLQHVLGQPKGPLHVRHAQNTCTMGC